ncbi:hypothetical protein Bbelb_330900 [Branchiostoma belcheri]|nr:hypothetical protein Bbelb_330900 [Branchiostoma belcheri]
MNDQAACPPVKRSTIQHSYPSASPGALQLGVNDSEDSITNDHESFDAHLALTTLAGPSDSRKNPPNRTLATGVPYFNGPGTLLTPEYVTELTMVSSSQACYERERTAGHCGPTCGFTTPTVIHQRLSCVKTMETELRLTLISQQTMLKDLTETLPRPSIVYKAVMYVDKR